MKRGGTLIAGSLLAGLVLAPSAWGATFAVTRTADTPPNGCANQGCTLREAALAANNRGGPDTVMLRSGRTYELGIAGADEEAAMTGDLDLTGPTTVKPDGRRRAEVDAAGLDRAFDALASAKLSRILIVGATAQAMAGEEKGGAIRAAAGRLLVTGSIVRGANSPPLGLGSSNGAIHKVGGGGDLVAVRTRVVGTNGTGIKNDGAGDIVVRASRVAESEYDGILDFAGGSIAVRSSRVIGSGNDGIKDFGVGGVSVRSSRVIGNDGDGVKDFGAGAILVDRSRLSANEFMALTDFGGGGIRVERSTLAGNRGGAQDFNAGGVVIRQTEISGNQFQGVQEFDGGDVSGSNTRLTANGSQGMQEFGAGAVHLSGVDVRGSGSQGIQEFDGGGVRVARGVIAGSQDEGVAEHSAGGLRLIRVRVNSNGGRGASTDDERVLVSRSQIDGNDDGGILIGDGSSALIRNTTISRNHATDDGGGIYKTGAGTLTVVNSTIASNRADDNGGGIATDSGADARLNAVTVARNLADADNTLAGAGGGLRASGVGTFEVRNSLLVLNNQTTGDADDCAGVFTSLGHNIRGSTADCGGFTGPGDRVRSNPRIGRLRDNGGPTQTIGLKRGSPAINEAGSDAPPRDQRGRRRGPNPDVGAFER